MNPAHEKPCRGIGRQQHVDHFTQRRGIQHHGEVVDLRGPTIDESKAGRRVHPRIHHHHKDRGSRAACRDQNPRGPMCLRGHALPPVEIDAEKDGFREEGESFEGEQKADDLARPSHEGGPQESELEREHRPGHRADGEQNRRALGPTFCQDEIDGLTGAQPSPFGNRHHERQGNADRRKDDVEAQGHGHLRARGNQIGHDSLVRV